tara:strand:+ start:254 stop:463 length:210 start_codon:yes stop_codon:yes gene_type:complete
MKNFGSILTLLAISASVVSARVLPENSKQIEARTPYDYGELGFVFQLSSLTNFSKRNHRSLAKEEQEQG